MYEGCSFSSLEYSMQAIVTAPATDAPATDATARGEFLSANSEHRKA